AVKELATVDEQAASMEATLADLEALLTSAEGLDDELASVVSSIENHIADLKAGASLLDGTLATLEMQKELAEVMAAIEFGAEDTKGGAALTKAVASVDKKAESWLGKHFAAYYPAAKAEAAAAARLAALDLKTQKISVEAILSDVEAGLRKNADKEELTALAAKIESNADEVAELLAALTETRTEVETEYVETVETAVNAPSDFDLPALKQFNSAVAGTLAEADNSLAGLIARVEACVEQLEDIKTRLGNLETDIKDLEGLLDMIQSVTFMSEYSAENAIAYYTLGSESRADGKKVRNPQGTIDLRYVIRPASAAKALTASDLWDDEVKVFGYYANTITKAAPETFDFDITNVTADEAGNGIVTVTVSAVSLNESFYFKETGAKLALSIATGKTDLTSKFVEIVPKDKSGNVYVEAIELSVKSIEIDNGAKADLDAFITPDNVTVGGVTWTTSDANVVNVNENGVIEGMSVGSAVITATTKGTDEWGNTIQAQCNVKVNPAIRLSGPSYVEAKGNITIRIESPEYINPESVTWTSSAPTLAVITKTDDGNALISGEAMHYDMTGKAYIPITITCDIDGKATLYHEIRVIAVQPKGIVIEGLSSGQNALTLKKGQEYTFNSTVQPAEVDMTLFRFRYQSNNTGVVNVPDMEIGKVVANAIGSATVSVKVTDQGQYNYFYPARNEYVRYVDVTVEPYYVETLTLSAPDEIDLGTPVKITPAFTSDMEGKDPTDMSLTWESLNSDVASVDESGNVTGIQEGTAIIKATTTAGARKDNVPLSQTCTLTVRKPGVPVNVGEYYYSDGTWGPDANPSGKTVVGVIFAKVNAYAADPYLQQDNKQECTHGLVVGLAEVSSVYFATNSSASLRSPSQSIQNAGYKITDYTNVYGYGNTKGLSSNTDDIGFSVHTALNGYSLEAPSQSSGWYVPSYYEMLLLYNGKSEINTSLANANGSVIGSDQYWHSSIYTADNDYFYVAPFDMRSGSWTANSFGSIFSSWDALPVRVVLAF
ncbi:MAG: Ig-like domain-containing protein, partial [Bacteroidales bacterium]|nr:Ig-like domain-containing protein [Bacteroidales bacterium]